MDTNENVIEDTKDKSVKGVCDGQDICDSTTKNAFQKLNNESEKNKFVIQNQIENENNVDVSDDLIDKESRIDNGTALLLSPFIELGLFEEARNASKVNKELFLGVESYSGFITVNKTFNSNLFFWYFPIEGKPVNETPWLIWLQGGPGASSLTGLFDEIGPFTVDANGVLKSKFLL